MWDIYKQSVIAFNLHARYTFASQTSSTYQMFDGRTFKVAISYTEDMMQMAVYREAFGKSCAKVTLRKQGKVSPQELLGL